MTGGPPRSGATAEAVTFVYEGLSALTVTSPITGRRYRFGRPGARVDVDRRDAPSLAGVPNLRRPQPTAGAAAPAALASSGPVPVSGRRRR